MSSTHYNDVFKGKYGLCGAASCVPMNGHSAINILFTGLPKKYKDNYHALLKVFSVVIFGNFVALQSILLLWRRPGFFKHASLTFICGQNSTSTYAWKTQVLTTNRI